MTKKSKTFMITFTILSALCLTLLPASSAYAACPAEISSYWKMDETTPGTYEDFIRDNDGTGSANVTAATGIVNGAQEFNGTDTEINVPADNSFDWQSDESFSIEFWMKFGGSVPPGATQVMISRTDASTGMAWWVGINGGDGKISINMRDTTGAGAAADMDGVGTADPTDGSWHHVVAVRAESTNENFIYVDGDLQDSRTFDFPAGFGSATAALNIGHFGSGNYFDGLIDEVALYDRALPQDEIEEHYEAGLAGNDYCSILPFAPYPDLTIAHLKLDEAAGPTYEDSFSDNDGTGSANVTAATGIVNGAQEFNGTDTEINVPADNSFDWQSDESFSIEFWMKFGGSVPPGATQVMISRADASTGMAWWVGINGGDGKISTNMRDTTGAGAAADMDGVGTADPTDGSWHHVVAVRAESTNENFIYVDGDLQDSKTFDFPAGFTSATAALNIGHFGSGNYFDGLIDEVALYDRALPQDEIEEHYEAGLLGNGIGDFGGGTTEIISTWSDGFWYWDVAESQWTQMYSSPTTGDIAAGDFTGDGIADVASIWPSGLWYQDGASLAWTKVPGSAPNRLTAGDVTGDSRFEIIGTWSSGIWYWDAAQSSWTQMTSSVTDGDIAAGNFTGDGIADVASIWTSGLWYQNGATLAWTRIPGTAPDSVTAGDVTGDDRFEIIGTWSSGIWYWDVAESKWTQMTTSDTTGDIAAGDFTGDGIADVASIWPSGIWYQDGATLAWTQIPAEPGGAPNRVTAADVTGQ